MKKIVKSIFRGLGLISVLEKVNFYRVKIQNKKKNTQFKIDNSDIVLPPDFYLYETFGLDYDRYYNGGKKTAQWILENLEKHLNLKNATILDWGCGPARIVRHLPNLKSTLRVYGSDYNKDYVAWCTKKIDNVITKKNELAPPLPFDADYFNAIYSISIFTHLSEKMHYSWMQELNRVSKKGGVVLITTHGEASKSKLTLEEQIIFDSGKIVEHKYKLEGNRLYASYQPKKFFKSVIESNGFKVLEHLERGVINGKPTQDVWIIKKISNC